MKKLLLLFALLSFFLISFSQQSSYSSSPNLYGYVKSNDNRPIENVSLRISGYSVTTDENGFYKFHNLRNKEYVVSVSPPQKRTKYFRIRVNESTRKDWNVDW